MLDGRVPDGVPALDVGEVVKDLVVGRAVVADLLVAKVQITRVPAAVQVPGHVDEVDVRIVDLQLVHQSQVGDDVGFAGAGDLPAPGPHHDVHLAVGRVAEVVARGGGPGGAVGIAQVAGAREGRVAEIERAAGAAGVVAEEVGGQREAPAAAVGEGDQTAHAGGQLAAMGSMAVGDVELILGLLHGRLRQRGNVRVVVVDHDRVRQRRKRRREHDHQRNRQVPDHRRPPGGLFQVT